MKDKDLNKLLVKNILLHPVDFDWSVQGLGMMRLYLSDEVRLHVWDSCLKIAGVSPLHTHPWDMESLVVAGRYKQHRYKVRDDFAAGAFEEFNCSEIKCGEDASVNEPTKIMLIEQALEVYAEQQSYKQTKDEIHVSLPEDGTITIIERKFHEDREHAFVYWRGKGGWVDAKPRPATTEEVLEVTQRSLAMWF